MKTLILYHTQTGHTKEAADALVRGIEAQNGSVELCLAKSFTPALLDKFDALIVGSPCWGGSFGVLGAATPVVKALKSIPSGSIKGKKLAAFATHAIKGGDKTINHISKLLKKAGASQVEAGPIGKAGTLKGDAKGPSVSSSKIKVFEKFGSDFVS